MSRTPLIYRIPCTLATLALCLLAIQPTSGHAMNLDELTSAQLQAALDAELGDDEFHQFGIDPRKSYPLEVLHEFIMHALSDENDEDDEQLIAMDELEEEMEEAGTDLSHVVWDALAQSDRVAGLFSGRSAIRKVARYLAREDGLTPAGPAATQAKLAVRLTVQRVKR